MDDKLIVHGVPFVSMKDFVMHRFTNRVITPLHECLHPIVLHDFQCLQLY